MHQVGVWHDHEAALRDASRIGAQYGLHDLQLQALDVEHQMPQALESEDWLIVNFSVPRIEKRSLKATRISVIIDKTQAVTIHAPDMEIMSHIHDRIALTPRISSSPTGVLAIVADVVTEQFTPVLDYVDEAIDRIEEAMIKHPEEKQQYQLFHYKKILVDFRRIVLPTTAVLDALSDGRHQMIDKKYATYLRDSYDYAWRAHDLTDNLRDLLASALDTYQSIVSNRMNDVMKRLTVVTTVFMPISFLVGFGGMNFTHLPFADDWAFWGLMILIVLMPAAMLWYFKLRKWL